MDGAVKLFSAADLIVIPSRAEGFSYVLAEALLSRRPVIATSGVSGAKELMPERLLVPPGDPKSLHTALRERLTSLDSYDQEFKALYEWAENHLTIRP